MTFGFFGEVGAEVGQLSLERKNSVGFLDAQAFQAAHQDRYVQRRRYYRITPDGIAAAQAEAKRMQTLVKLAGAYVAL